MSKVKICFIKQQGWVIGETSENQNGSGSIVSYTIKNPCLLTEEGFIPLMYFSKEKQLTIKAEDLLGDKVFESEKGFNDAYKKQFMSPIVLPDKNIKLN